MKQSKNKKESVGLEKEEMLNKKSISYVMSAEDQEAYDFYRRRFDKAKQQRDQVYEEFDDQNYEQDYLSSQRAMVSYLKKKINDSDVRVVTGTTEKRIETVLNELMSMNLQPEVMAFDTEDKEIVMLGDAFSDLVKRSNEMEFDEDKKLEMYIELISQRAVFIEEVYSIKTTRNGTRKTRMCSKRMVPGLQVFLGDIKLPAYRFNDQPYYLKYKRMTYDEASTIYGDYDNWKHVKPGAFNKTETNNPYDYRLGDIDTDEVEIIEYCSEVDNEYQVMINGVLMYDRGTGMPHEHDGYNMTMVVLKPIHPRFAYGKPLTASAKTLQALNDESFRNVIRKWRQAIEPPMGVKAGKIYSKDIWNPGSMTQGVGEKDFSILNPGNVGLTNSDKAMLDFVEAKTNEFIGTSVLQSSPTKRMTATEIIQQQKQAVKMLGMAVISAMRLVREVTYLRIYNLIENEIVPVKKEFNTFNKQIENVYRAFTVKDATIDGDKKGKKIIGFMDRPLLREEEEAIYRKQKEEADKGNVVKYQVINNKRLREIKPTWYVVVVNKERDSSELSKAMFTEKLAQAAQIMGLTQRQLNADNVIESFERTWKDKNLFEKTQGDMVNELTDMFGKNPMAPGGKKTQANENINKGLNQGVTEGAKEEPLKPSLNTMLNEETE